MDLAGLSQLGTSVSSLAYPLLLLGITGSAAVAGLAATLVAVVALGVRVPGGIVADRYRHKALMLVSDAARTVVVAAVGISVLLDAVSVPFVLTAMALEVACAPLLVSRSSHWYGCWCLRTSERSPSGGCSRDRNSRA